MKKIKVLVVDDSALIRKVLSDIFDADPNLEVVGVASDPIIARDKIKKLNPDVITLDIEMPRMDGLTFLKNLMRLRPMPVVMISTLTQKGAAITLDALEIGAVDFYEKPKVDAGGILKAYSDELIAKVTYAASANVRAFDPDKFTARNYSVELKGRVDIDKWIAIGASTGGTEAVKEVLSALPEGMPPIVVTQHIPDTFSESFAARLGKNSRLTVHHVAGGELIQAGHVYLAPGGKHLQFEKRGGRYVCALSDAPKVNLHKPSVEVMFDSVRAAAGKDVIAVMLTGMGADGALAMARLHEAGAQTLAQDEATSVVWGMPGACVTLGVVDEVLPLGQIAQKLVTLSSQGYSAKTHKM